jgi:hypothetical protein
MKTRKLFWVMLMWVIVSGSGLVFGQQSGAIWIQTFLPGSADLMDRTIDKRALAFVDSLMQRNDIEVIFLGAADRIKWKSLPQEPQLSSAFDQAKKLERALQLRQRYGRGEIGITDEPIRGVKVVWSPKKPDPFKMRADISELQAANDSLRKMFANLKSQQAEYLAAMQESLKTQLAPRDSLVETKMEISFADWEVKTGILTWTAGAPWDLSVPCIGLSLKRQYWAFEIEGGFTPWSRQGLYGDRGDALVMASVSMYPQHAVEIKAGAFSGWEFLSRTDQWTMKVMGMAAGPSIKWKFMEGFLGYTFSRLSSLTRDDRWVSGVMFYFNFKFLVN